MFFRYVKYLFALRKSGLFVFTVTALVFILHFFLADQRCDNVVSEKKNSPRLTAEQVDELKKVWMVEQQHKASKNIDTVDEPPNGSLQQLVAPVECLINDNYTVQCLKSSSGEEQVYMPFNFLEKYFEVYGKMKHYDGYDRFEFQQSLYKVVYKPKPRYLYNGVFMTFDTYNVEVRDRVKCISGVEGVPLCTQWSTKGYFYPIQIAQYAMSHYSKNLVQKPPQRTVYEDAESDSSAKNVRWKSTNHYCQFERQKDIVTQSQVIKFFTPESVPLGSGVTLVLGNTMEHELTLDIQFTTNGSFSVVLDTTDKTKQYTIHYVTTTLMIDYDDNSNIFYGIGPTRSWRRIARDLLTDLRKGVGLAKKKRSKKSKLGIQKVSRIIFRGSGFVDNVTISTYDHLTHFRDGCDWIVANQDPVTGGWKNDVPRTLPGFNTLDPGWLSAMAQGQGLSTLARAYHVHQDDKYLKAMTKALLPFSQPSAEGGVKAVFLDRYTWYEEYPTTPSSFVLNGFMFSVIGLYDFKALLEDKFGFGGTDASLSGRDVNASLKATYNRVSRLYKDGMTSLSAMLPLFDGGSRTFYDLRHFMLKVQPNVARWDYHTTHLSQLALIASVSDDPVFKQFYEYWTGYLKGVVAKHN